LHLKVAVPLLLQIWADFRREKVSKNTESIGEQFTSPSSSFVHQVLIAIDSDLKRRFGAIENAIESTPLATFKQIKPRQVPCLSEIGSDCGTEITDEPVGEFGGNTS
jgi:hypothetical protein